MNARSLVTTGTLFMVANLGAGVLNYLFQVIASQRLSGEDFSSMSSWIAHVSVFFILAGILQYSSNFLPASSRFFKSSLVAFNLIYVGLISLWFMLDPGLSPLKAALMVVSTALFGWAMGQVQGRLLFFTVALANLAIGTTKILVAFVPLPLSDLEKFVFIFFIGNLPALWFITVSGIRYSAPPQRGDLHSGHQGLLAAGLLSAYSILIPQIDLIILDWTQPREIFNDIARASIFYKAIYFFFFAIAQFLLPIQLKATDRSLNSWFGSIKLAAAALLACGVLAQISPWIVRSLLHWDSEPARDLIFLPCLNMTILTWLFLLAQEACARKATLIAALGLTLMASEWALQWLLALPTASYFTLAIISRAATLIVLYRGLRNHPSHRSPSTTSL
jgi:hypothetical protein